MSWGIPKLLINFMQARIYFSSKRQAPSWKWAIKSALDQHSKVFWPKAAFFKKINKNKKSTVTFTFQINQIQPWIPSSYPKRPPKRQYGTGTYFRKTKRQVSTAGIWTSFTALGIPKLVLNKIAFCTDSKTDTVFPNL